MSVSWRDADPSVLTSHLSAPVSDANGPYRYRVLIDGGSVIQEEAFLSPNRTQSQQVSARYFVGSGKHALAMVAEESEYLTQLPLAWFPTHEQWRLSPGYELHNRRFSRPVLPACVGCHGGRTRHVAPTRNRYAGLVGTGVSCEHCHGPGQKHIAQFDSSGERELAPDATPDTSGIVNPGAFSPAAVNDLCLQCHLQGDIVVYQPGADAFSFRPGDRLCDHRLDFLLKRGQSESFGVASHGARMMQSRCYLESERRLTCIHCHDPHQSVEKTPRPDFDRRCMACHGTGDCSLSIDQRSSPTDGCVKCHMRQRPTREGQHLVFTDHWIQIPADNVDGGELTGQSSAIAYDEQLELVPLWPEADPDSVRLAEAYVRLHESIGPHPPSLDRAVELLRPVSGKHPEDRGAQFWAAVAEIGRRNSAAAIRLLEPLVVARPDDSAVRFRLAVALDQNREYERAISEYERVVARTPDWLEPYPLLARLYLYRNRSADAERLTRQQLTFRATPDAWATLALARHLQSADLTECLSLIERALAVDPRDATAWMNRGIIFMNSNKPQDAIESFGIVLEIDPSNEKARIARQAILESNQIRETPEPM